MRKLPVFFLALFIIACNNSAKKKKSIEDTAKTVKQIPGNPLVPDTVFTGFGNEPFWAVYVLAESKIVFHPADGFDIEVPFTAATSIGDTTFYHSSSGAYSIELSILKKDCSDGMSDLVHPYEVMLQVNKTKYAGCGRISK
ncbi:MAG: hypothetical protein ABIR30_10575 [Chitinophagaceae bacterium]